MTNIYHCNTLSQFPRLASLSQSVNPMSFSNLHLKPHMQSEKGFVQIKIVHILGNGIEFLWYPLEAFLSPELPVPVSSTLARRTGYFGETQFDRLILWTKIGFFSWIIHWLLDLKFHLIRAPKDLQKV